jgi:dTDP-4-dehydrorhamnose 3,5-epimerase
VLYKVSAPWSPAHERTLAWNAPGLGINWPLQGRTPLLSAKDQNGLGLEALKENPCVP